MCATKKEKQKTKYFKYFWLHSFRVFSQLKSIHMREFASFAFCFCPSRRHFFKIQAFSFFSLRNSTFLLFSERLRIMSFGPQGNYYFLHRELVLIINLLHKNTHFAHNFICFYFDKRN